MFCLAVLLAALGVGVLGVLMELVLLRRIYRGARAVPAARHLRRGAGRAGPGAEGLGAARHPGPARARPAPCRRYLRPPLPGLRAVHDRDGPAGAGPAVAADAQDALRRAGARGDAGSRDGGGARRQPGAAVHRHAVPRRLPGRPRRRAADAQARRQRAHGHLGDRRSLRGDGGRRHGLGARRVPGGGADRPAAGVRHPGVSQDHPGAGVPADGAGAGGAAVGAAGQARCRPWPRRAARGHPQPRALRADGEDPDRRRGRCCCWRCRGSAMPT